jgi:polar amino acid transport system substrate-binding protein
MRTLTCFLILALCLLSAPARANEEAYGPYYLESLTFVADDWCPYNCAPDSDHPGYIVEILKAAFEKHGYRVQYIPVPWTRAIEEVTTGKYTGLISTSVANTPQLVFPSVAQGAYGPAAASTFYVRTNDDWRYDGVKSLETRTLGMIADYLYGEEFDKYVADNADNMDKVQIVAGSGYALASNINKLVSGRIDIIVEDPFVIAWFLSQNPHFKNRIKAAGDLGDGNESTYVAFSPAHPEAEKLARILSEEQTAMTKNGELHRILARYGIEGL